MVNESRSTSQFGNRLKKFRKECNLTQQQVADVINLNRTTYTKYETGVSEPSHEVLRKIVNLFGITFDDLLAEKDTFQSSFADYEIGTMRLNSDEKRIVYAYRTLSEARKDEFMRNMTLWITDKKNR